MVEPLVWNKRTGNLVGGHQRLKILKEMGVKGIEVSVVDLDDVKEKALNLALNKISGEWDFPMLKDLLQELDTGEMDMEITGFDTKEIEDLMTQFHQPEEGLTDDDAVPEATESISKRGDLWELGNHRLLCGDATVREDVDRLMGGEKADMVFTDPPYGINLDTDFTALTSKRSFSSSNKFSKVVGDDKPFDASFILSMADEVLLFGADYYINTLPVGGSWLVWDKRADESQDKGYGSCFELIWSKQKHKRWMLRHNWFGFFTGGEKREYTHPTEKPVSLLIDVVSKISRVESILDLFGGSGSTLIACEKLGRRCYMMEIDEHYTDVIIKRWEAFTGKQAVRLDEVNTEARNVLSKVS